jgi:hypothetical protein
LERKVLLRWLLINSLCFTGMFLTGSLLIKLFPHPMLGLLNRWVSLIELTGGKRMAELPSRMSAFTHIVTRNSLSVLIAFIVGLLLLAPPVMSIWGLFYSLVAFAVPTITGSPRPLNFWILITFEALFLIIPATYTSVLASEIFGIKPEKGPLLEHWKRELKTLLTYFPERKRDWREVFDENLKESIFFIITVASLLLLGAWFEVWVY